jgi:hypothetical protein
MPEPFAVCRIDSSNPVLCFTDLDVVCARSLERYFNHMFSTIFIPLENFS